MESVTNQAIFRDIELAGEQFKQQFRQLAEKAQRGMDSKIQSAKFEAAYALTVSKSQRKLTMGEVKEVRNELWQEAMRKSNNDPKKASAFYDQLCDFA